ncbi:MAG: hypothetical protein R2731_09845 [Nocardioides sp.]
MDPPDRRSLAPRILLIGVVDVIVVGLVATLAFRVFGATSGVDTLPPECYNASGGVVSCSPTPPVLMIPTFLVALPALVGWQLRRWRSARKVLRSMSKTARPVRRTCDQRPITNHQE